MRLATILTPSGTSAAARLDDDGYHPLPYGDLSELLRAEDGLEVAEGSKANPVHEPTVLMPVQTPGKVICVGMNYRKHIEETGEPTPAFPTLFTKFADSLLGPLDPLVIPIASDRVDWEAELVVVIGRTVRDVDVRNAERAIAGFTVGNDVSMRDYQGRTSQWLQGKAWEASSPVGPTVLTVDDCGPRPDLRITCSVNGIVKQDSTTSDLLFDVPELVAYVSRFATLNPGDLIFTGTPGGVGQARPSPEFLAHGDVLTTAIERIGECRNECVATIRTT